MKIAPLEERSEQLKLAESVPIYTEQEDALNLEEQEIEESIENKQEGNLESIQASFPESESEAIPEIESKSEPIAKLEPISELEPIPESKIEPAPKPVPAPEPKPEPDYKYDYNDEMEKSSSPTVYISKSGKIHSVSGCSGMKDYRTMSLEKALNTGYKYCSNCW